eukprot:gnl/TRDRNA2_/TRDRNA2_67689_c0_seq1.p1 gnl/TRDRNA2_/TRDRNA2_67689_c0~~gnl/TRDRNA2_/TRDRNA2_67689_c0_seq1.p1  ORF type:complete len:751 (+),score=107.94 gnl/TRDRNA2_/TRDRNA2_67689_c0_seq1:42-2294(+)
MSDVVDEPDGHDVGSWQHLEEQLDELSSQLHARALLADCEGGAEVMKLSLEVPGIETKLDKLVIEERPNAKGAVARALKAQTKATLKTGQADVSRSTDFGIPQISCAGGPSGRPVPPSKSLIAEPQRTPRTVKRLECREQQTLAGSRHHGSLADLGSPAAPLHVRNVKPSATPPRVDVLEHQPLCATIAVPLSARGESGKSGGCHGLDEEMVETATAIARTLDGLQFEWSDWVTGVRQAATARMQPGTPRAPPYHGVPTPNRSLPATPRLQPELNTRDMAVHQPKPPLPRKHSSPCPTRPSSVSASQQARALHKPNTCDETPAPTPSVSEQVNECETAAPSASASQQVNTPQNLTACEKTSSSTSTSQKTSTVQQENITVNLKVREETSASQAESISVIDEASSEQKRVAQRQAFVTKIQDSLQHHSQHTARMVWIAWCSHARGRAVARLAVASSMTFLLAAARVAFNAWRVYTKTCQNFGSVDSAVHFMEKVMFSLRQVMLAWRTAVMQADTERSAQTALVPLQKHLAYVNSRAADFRTLTCRVLERRLAGESLRGLQPVLHGWHQAAIEARRCRHTHQLCERAAKQLARARDTCKLKETLHAWRLRVVKLHGGVRSRRAARFAVHPDIAHNARGARTNYVHCQDTLRLLEEVWPRRLQGATFRAWRSQTPRTELKFWALQPPPPRRLLAAHSDRGLAEVGHRALRAWAHSVRALQHDVNTEHLKKRADWHIAIRRRAVWMLACAPAGC